MINILWKVLGPVVLSAFSIFLSFHLLQPIALLLNQSFNLLASRGVGKVAFVTLVIVHIFLLLAVSARSLWNSFLETCIYFFYQELWIKKFFIFFTLFFGLHATILVAVVQTGYATYHPTALVFTSGKILSLLFGFFVTFFLAWSEELIFRGTLYQYFAQFWRPLPSALITSIIFSLVHDITNPLNLITTHWKLGFGLFLLGFLLNLIFIVTQKLYTGMGVHAGLVYVKVILRRFPLITYAPMLPFWLDIDLRQSLLIHILFCMVIAAILIKYKNILFITYRQQNH